MYTIKIDYTTGNSFGSSNETETVGYVWKDLDDVKKTLQNIKEHYEYYQKYNGRSWGDSASSHSQINKEVQSKSFYVIPTGNWSSADSWQYCVAIVDKHAEEPTHIHSFWTGYFESLNVASIETIDDDDEDDMTIYF